MRVLPDHEWRSSAHYFPFVAMLRALLLGLAFLASPTSAEERVFGAYSSFVPPNGCQVDRSLAARVGASIACVERFSPTHEFAVSLVELRWTPPPQTKATSEHAKIAVEEHLAELIAANEERADGTLQVKRRAWFKPEYRARNADHCAALTFIMIDSHVPAHAGEDFILAANVAICGRISRAENVVIMVHLAITERMLLVKEEIDQSYSAKSQAAIASLAME